MDLRQPIESREKYEENHSYFTDIYYDPWPLRLRRGGTARFGTYALSDEQAENSVYWALRDGYRLIDTARIYGNESGVGRGIKRAVDEGIVKREDIFVTTRKILRTGHHSLALTGGQYLHSRLVQ